MLNTQRNTWQARPDYPFDQDQKGFFFKYLNSYVNLSKVNSYIRRAPIVYVIDAFYVVGGYTDISYDDSTIGKLDSNSNWSKAGELSTGRRGHAAIYDGNFMLVVGGQGHHKTEKCAFSSSGITCTEQNPSLYYYTYYPELFMVPADYCKSLP